MKNRSRKLMIGPDLSFWHMSESYDDSNTFLKLILYLTSIMACSSDLWALGCIIYQLLSGAVPFRAVNEYQTFKKISALDYEIPVGFPSTAKVSFVFMEQYFWMFL